MCPLCFGLILSAFLEQLYRNQITSLPLSPSYLIKIGLSNARGALKHCVLLGLYHLQAWLMDFMQVRVTSRNSFWPCLQAISPFPRLIFFPGRSLIEQFAAGRWSHPASLGATASHACAPWPVLCARARKGSPGSDG